MFFDSALKTKNVRFFQVEKLHDMGPQKYTVTIFVIIKSTKSQNPHYKFSPLHFSVGAEKSAKNLKAKIPNGPNPGQ